MKKTAVYKWVKHCSEGRDSVTDKERSGQPATSRTEENIAQVCQIVHENCQLTVRSIAEKVNIDRETVRKILTEVLDMRKVCAKMVPKEPHQRTKAKKSKFAKTFWRGKMTFWDVSSQVMKHGSTNTTKKVPSVQIKSQTMLLTFFDIRGIVLYEFVQTGQTVKQVYCLQVLERLREKVRWK